MSDQPFVVAEHPLMLLQCAGRVEGTVLTVEQMIYTTRICEYDEPLSYGRYWCYATAAEAIEAFFWYLADEDATEPVGWKKAVSPEGVRRPSVEVNSGEGVHQ